MNDSIFSIGLPTAFQRSFVRKSKSEVLWQLFLTMIQEECLFKWYINNGSHKGCPDKLREKTSKYTFFKQRVIFSASKAKSLKLVTNKKNPKFFKLFHPLKERKGERLKSALYLRLKKWKLFKYIEKYIVDFY